MTKYPYPFFTLCLSCAILGMASLSAEEATIVSIQEVNTGEEGLTQAFLLGQYPQLVISLPENTRFPIQLTCEGDILKVDDSSGTPCVTLLKTLYIRCQEANKLELSSDLSDWREASSFGTGNFCAAIVVENGSPSVNLQLDLFQKP